MTDWDGKMVLPEVPPASLRPAPRSLLWRLKRLAVEMLVRSLRLDTIFAVLLERHERQQVSALQERLGIPRSVSIGYPVRIEGNVRIGEGTYINPYAEIESGPNSEVRIGRHCAIARFVCIRAVTHDPQNGTGPDMRFIEKDIVIGDHVWIGTKAFIKEGVVIGHHAVVGAGAVVTRDVPPLAVVGGVPARILRRLDPAQAETIAKAMDAD